MLVCNTDTLINEAELREELGVTAHELNRMWKTGLKFVTVGRTSRLYLASNLIEWFKANQQPDAKPQEDQT